MHDQDESGRVYIRQGRGFLGDYEKAIGERAICCQGGREPFA